MRDFYTITIGEKCYDLPKDMPVPQIGNRVFIDNRVALVENVNYHIDDKSKRFSISVFATRD